MIKDILEPEEKMKTYVGTVPLTFFTPEAFSNMLKNNYSFNNLAQRTFDVFNYCNLRKYPLER